MIRNLKVLAAALTISLVFVLQVSHAGTDCGGSAEEFYAQAQERFEQNREKLLGCKTDGTSLEDVVLDRICECDRGTNLRGCVEGAGFMCKCEGGHCNSQIRTLSCTYQLNADRLLYILLLKNKEDYGILRIAKPSGK